MTVSGIFWHTTCQPEVGRPFVCFRNNVFVCFCLSVFLFFLASVHICLLMGSDMRPNLVQ